MRPEQNGVRKRRKQAEIQQLVADFLSSGMRETEFCRSRGLSWDTLNRHLKKQGKKQDRFRPVSRLVRVKVAGKRRMELGDSAGLVVVVGGGRRIEVRPGFDGHLLAEVVQVLERE